MTPAKKPPATKPAPTDNAPTDNEPTDEAPTDNEPTDNEPTEGTTEAPPLAGAEAEAYRRAGAFFREACRHAQTHGAAGDEELGRFLANPTGDE